LHRLLDGCHEVLDIVLLLLCHDLGLLSQLFKVDDGLFLLSDVLFHLQQTLGLHVEQFLKIVQVLLQTFDLLFFRLETGFHFEGAMGQDLLSLLQVFNLELLLE